MLLVYSSVAFTNVSGLAVADGADVEVRLELNGALAALFADRDGTTPLTNPFNADSQGRFAFYTTGLVDGYSVEVSKGAETHTLRHQLAIATNEFYATELMSAAQRSDVLNNTGAVDVTAALNAAEDARPAGSTLIWQAGTYLISGDITADKAGTWDMRGCTINSTAGRLMVETSNFTLEGGNTAFNFTPGAAASSLNRAVRVGGGISSDSPGYGVTGAIAVGAMSFTADNSAEAATLANGDWIFIVDHDVTNWVRTEMKQVLSVSGTTINLTTPFAQAFNGDYPIEYVKVTTLRENVWVNRLRINIADTSQDNLGFDGQPGVVNSGCRDLVFNLARGNAWAIYGWYNPTFIGFDVLRQQGKRCAWSSNTLGMCQGVIREGVAQSTNGALTVETGSFGGHFEVDAIGGNSASSVFYVNNSHKCSFDNGTVIGNGLNICIHVHGSTDCTFGSRLVLLHSVEGITIQTDAGLTPDMGANGNKVVWPTLRNLQTGVKVQDVDCNRNTVLVEADSTVSTALLNFGTDTVALSRDSTNSMGFIGGVRMGNVDVALSTVLDWYLEGAWTPELTFGTAGDVSVAYSVQNGRYTRIGNKIFIVAEVATSSFTHTTASGEFLITGLPFAPLTIKSAMATIMQGYTNSNFTQVQVLANVGDTRMSVRAGGSGQTSANLTTADVPTGGTIHIFLSGYFEV